VNDPTSDQDRTLDPDVLASLAQAVAPVEPLQPRATALRARLLAAAASTTQMPAIVMPGFQFVAVGERRWERRRLGVDFCLLHENAHSRAFLLRLQPGGVLPAHTHEMDEESLMLEGDAWIGDTRHLTAGDYHFAPGGTPHPDLRSPNGCVVFVRGESSFKPKITPSLIARLISGAFKRD